MVCNKECSVKCSGVTFTLRRDLLGLNDDWSRYLAGARRLESR